MLEAIRTFKVTFYFIGKENFPSLYDVPCLVFPCKVIPGIPGLPIDFFLFRNPKNL